VSNSPFFTVLYQTQTTGCRHLAKRSHNMDIKFFCPRWGSEHTEWGEFCRRVKQAGYDGVEAGVPFDSKEKNQMIKALQKNNLLLVGQYFQSFEKDFAAHKRSFEKYLRHIAALKPIKIDAQTGKDYFSFEQNAELFALAQTIEKETGISICHETHRNKALFAAHVTHQYLQQIPSLKITADFSHWCNVAESLLEDQQEAVKLACKHAHHIHARVGHAESAQVVDPRLTQYENELSAHLKWWDAIVKLHQKNKAAMLTITPEFGPAPYMVHIPFTNVPLANQWEINVHMMNLLKKRYAK
jgi:sugar phosphate isomerase/epimerase